MSEQLILVDEHDHQIGEADKLYVHQHGLLHRAFSIFIYRIYDNQMQFLLQKRNKTKYHSGGLWTNSCCSHPRSGESLTEATVRRLREEIGLESDLLKIGLYHYKSHVGNNLIEHEMDHLFVGKWQEDKIIINPNEIEDFSWMNIEEIDKKLALTPELFTAWFAETYHLVKNHFTI